MSAQYTMNVFDLDGVITNPQNSEINRALLEEILQHLKEGNAAAVNTGRSYEWVEKNLLDYFKEQGSESVLERILVVCEKGGEMAKLSGGEATVTPSRFALSEGDYKATKETFEKLKSQLTTMFWDDTKRTMATIEKLPKADLEKFHTEQAVLVEALEKRFPDKGVRIDATVIATDVESAEAGKYAGAELIYEWAHGTYPNIAEFVCYGDSASDYAMARCFADRGAEVKFVYVGNKPDNLPTDERVRLVVTAQKFDTGTLEYLSSY